MNWPKDGTMVLLLGIAGECDISPDENGVLRLTAPELTPACGRAGLVVPLDAFDELEERSWITIPETGRPVATDAGRYWARRWVQNRKWGRRLVWA